MRKYKLISKYGNEVVFTDNELRKNSLIEKGFHIEELPKPKKSETPKAETEQPKAKRKAVKKNEGTVED